MVDVHGSGSFAVAVNVVDNFEELYRFENLAEAAAFASGWNSGSDKFGGDGFAVAVTEAEIKDWMGSTVNEKFFRAVRAKMKSLGLVIPSEVSE